MQLNYKKLVQIFRIKIEMPHTNFPKAKKILSKRRQMQKGERLTLNF